MQGRKSTYLKLKQPTPVENDSRSFFILLLLFVFQVFDKSVFDETIVTEFNLVCGNEWKTDLSTSLYYLGFGVGGIVGGIVSDRFGRKPIIILGSGLLLVFGIANTWSNSIWMFAFVRFLIGCAVTIGC